MLQNRVDPEGNIIKTTARGLWMGNRGLIHNAQQQITRPYRLHAWITCRLQYKGMKRPLMSPNHYTELFFMDEATAFSAGHRPCAFCRREDYNTFKSCWIKGNPETGFNEKTSIRLIDDYLQEERIKKDGSKKIHHATLDELHDGAFVLLNCQPFLVYHKQLWLWSPFGYEKAIVEPMNHEVEVLTPLSIIGAFKAGYMPQVNKEDKDNLI